VDHRGSIEAISRYGVGSGIKVMVLGGSRGEREGQRTKGEGHGARGKGQGDGERSLLSDRDGTEGEMEEQKQENREQKQVESK